MTDEEFQRYVLMTLGGTETGSQERQGLKPPNMQQLDFNLALRRLEKTGLVERSRVTDYIRLTNKGWDWLEKTKESA